MSNLEWKRKIGKLWPAKQYGRKIILLYHSVGESLWGMQTKQFSDQINWLTDNYQIISLSDLIKSEPNENIQIALTFDDGYESLHSIALPLLSNKKINATVYLNTGWIGDSNEERKLSDSTLGHYPSESFLIWPEVLDLYNAGWEIGSHGVNHFNFARTEESIMKNEFISSKNEIESRLKTNCPHFAYPWGQYSNLVKKTAKEVGYKYAAAAFHSPLKRYSDSFSLPRINVARDYSFQDFKNIIKGKWDYLGLIHRLKGL